jgi:hypothetical protein
MAARGFPKALGLPGPRLRLQILERVGPAAGERPIYPANTLCWTGLAEKRFSIKRRAGFSTR